MEKRVWSLSPSFGHFISSPTTFLEQNGVGVDLLPATEKLTMEQALVQIAAYDALIPGLFPVTADLMDAAPRLKVVAMTGAGVNHIDVAAATKRDIVVTNTPGTNHQAVAELAIGLMFTLARKIVSTDTEVKGGGWPRVIGHQVSGKVLGIVGLGLIGKALAKLALALGMEVAAFDAFPDEAFAKRYGIKFLDLDALMASADFVSVHVPLMAETMGLIGEKRLRTMKPTSYLINLSRGKVVDEAALHSVLADGGLAGAALDVFAEEPPQNSPLLTLPNLITTSHMGGYTYEAIEAVGMICVRNIVDVLNGRRAENILNPEVLVKSGF